MLRYQNENVVFTTFNYGSSIDFLTKLKIYCSVFFVFCNYYYLYLYDFNQGVSNAPGYYSGLKFFGVFLFVVAFFDGKIKRFYSQGFIIFAVFLFFSLALFLVKRVFIGPGSDLYLNVVLCSFPFLFLRMNTDLNRVVVFFEMSLWLLVFQILMELFIFANGWGLWENKAFIGGLGNPSSFGVFCNVCFAYIVFFRKFSISSIVLAAVVVVGILGTQSLFSVLAFVMISSYAFWRKSKLMLFAFVFISGVVLMLFWQSIMSGHLGYKFQSFYQLLFEGEVGGSQSVVLRIKIHEFFFKKLLDDPFGVLFWGYGDFYYYNADSQFLSFFGSFGIVLSSIFFGWVFLHLFRISGSGEVYRFFGISILMFFLMFFFNRVIDYYPMPLLFFFLIFGSLNRTRVREV